MLSRYHDLTKFHTGFMVCFVWLSSLIVYMLTLAPTVYTYDSAEISTAAYNLGLMHSPGYPVHLMLLHGFQKLVFWGDIGYRSNLFSAFAGSTTATVITALVFAHTQQRWLSVLTGLIYAWSFYAWSVAVVAEVYTMQSCLLVTLLAGLWFWQKTHKPYMLWGCALIGGLTVANNPSALLWGLGLIIMACWPLITSPHPWRVLIVAIGLFALGCTALLYLPLRSLANPDFVNVGWYQADGSFLRPRLATWNGFWWYISGQQFGSLFWGDSQSLVSEVRNFSYWLLAAFGGVGLPIGLFGIVRMWRLQRVFLIGTLLIFIAHAAFFITYAVPDKSTMFLPCFIIWVIYVGHGFAIIAEWVPRTVHVLSSVWPLVLLVINWSYCNVHDQVHYAEIARIRLESVPPNAIYIARWGDAETLRYMQVVENQRPDVHVINVFFAQPDVLYSIVEQTLMQQRSVYSAQLEPSLAAYRWQNEGLAYRLLFSTEEP